MISNIVYMLAIFYVQSYIQNNGDCRDDFHHQKLIVFHTKHSAWVVQYCVHWVVESVSVSCTQLITCLKWCKYPHTTVWTKLKFSWGCVSKKDGTILVHTKFRNTTIPVCFPILKWIKPSYILIRHRHKCVYGHFMVKYLVFCGDMTLQSA